MPMTSCLGSHRFEEQLRSRGVRPTPHRIAVLTVLHDEGMASAEELAGNGALAHMDKVTIYRTLKQLVSAGLVYETQAGHAGLHYQLVEHHTHVVKCVSCNKVDSIAADDDVLEKRLSSMRAKAFAHIHAHALTFFGICKGCERVVR